MVGGWWLHYTQTAENGAQRNGLTPEQLSEVIFAKEKTKDKEFWQEISTLPWGRMFIFTYLEGQLPRYPFDRLWRSITTSSGYIIPFADKGSGRVSRIHC